MNQTQMDNALECLSLELEEANPVYKNGKIPIYAIFRKPRKLDRNGNMKYAYTIHVLDRENKLYDITESVAKIFGVKRSKHFGEIVSHHTADRIMDTISQHLFNKQGVFLTTTY